MRRMAQDDDEEGALGHMQAAMDVLEEAGKERFGIDKFSKTLGFLAERGRCATPRGLGPWKWGRGGGLPRARCTGPV